MGLIEKAENDFGAANAAQEDLRAELSQDGTASLFDIDFGTLARHGFYTPEDRASRLCLELRSIKRALLRRIGFRHASGDRRLVRKGGRQRNLILVTSTRPGEGKTFCALNLALSLACEEEIDVMLVDADAPRPKVRAHLGLPQGPGLTDRLLDPSLSISSLTRRARQAPLSILSEGEVPARTSDLFGSDVAQRFFTELSLRRAGRVVIIDAPPVLATADAVLLARHVDEVIFVVEADSTPEAAAAAALDELLDANPNVGLLLNRCLVGQGGSYYGSYSDYDRYDKKPRGEEPRRGDSAEESENARV